MTAVDQITDHELFFSRRADRLPTGANSQIQTHESHSVYHMRRPTPIPNWTRPQVL